MAVSLVVSNNERKAGILEKHFWDDEQKCFIARVEWDKVHVDPAWGRSHDERHSSRLAERQLRVRPYPIVNLRQGVLYVPDGQHRKEAEKKKGRNSGNCMLVIGLTVEDEGTLYSGLNTVKNQNLWQRFKAELTGKNPKYVGIATAINATRLTYRLNARFGQADLTSAAAIIEANDAGILTSWLRMLEAFIVPENEIEMLHKLARKNIEFQRGLIDVLRLKGSRLSVNKAVPVLKRVGAALIDRKAEEISCHCTRTSRHHYRAAFEEVLAEVIR